jgi:MoxR-like ATPase
MALLSFKQVIGPVKLSLMSGAVPILVGERGIGKTSIARFIAKEQGWRFAHIDGNLLKEGEIGGLPTVVGEDGGSVLGNDEEFKKFINVLFGKLKSENKPLAKYVKDFYEVFVLYMLFIMY